MCDIPEVLHMLGNQPQAPSLVRHTLTASEPSGWKTPTSPPPNFESYFKVSVQQSQTPLLSGFSEPNLRRRHFALFNHRLYPSRQPLLLDCPPRAGNQPPEPLGCPGHVTGLASLSPKSRPSACCSALSFLPVNVSWLILQFPPPH